MIELTNFGTLTAGKTSRVGYVSNPVSSNSFNATSTAFAEQSKDKKDYVVENAVAYANPFSFESLFGGSDNSTVSAFDA
ncbi:hypothetical protein IJ732_00565 [bacterium]|nr:hypothetical protein [bacterium]